LHNINKIFRQSLNTDYIRKNNIPIASHKIILLENISLMIYMLFGNFIENIISDGFIDEKGALNKKLYWHPLHRQIDR
jgi:hypothetical protein